jgi:hypothetical protein
MVVLVAEDDQEIGAGREIERPSRGRSSSRLFVIVFDRSGRLLLQRRALDKYHSEVSGRIHAAATRGPANARSTQHIDGWKKKWDLIVL